MTKQEYDQMLKDLQSICAIFPAASTKEEVKSKSSKIDKCVRCETVTKVTVHHITYAPETTAKLCRDCHSMITFINTIGSVAMKISRKRDGDSEQINALRNRLWKWFISYKGVVSKYAVVKELGPSAEFVLTMQLSYCKLARSFRKKKKVV